MKDGYNYVLIIDGMEYEIHCSSNSGLKETTYSGKKGYYTFTQLIGVNREGKIWWLSKTSPGSCTDSNLCEFYLSPIVEALTDDEKIMADQGFRGLQNMKIYTQLPKPSNDKERKFNLDFKHFRSTVENVISQIRKWKFASQRYEGKLTNFDEAKEKHHQIMEVICGILNMFVLPLRHYEPSKK